MQFRSLLVLALVACVLLITLDAKSLGKHDKKKHDKKKHHIKHAKKQDTPEEKEGDAPAPADAGASEAAPADEAADDAKPEEAAAPAAAADDDADAAADSPAAPAAPAAQAASNPNDQNQDGIDDRLQQQASPQPAAAAAAPAPGAPAEEDAGSGSEESLIVPPGKMPILLGGHMRPGPPSEPNLYPEPRYCEAPCPQQCAPACYEWCCFASEPPSQPPVETGSVVNQLQQHLQQQVLQQQPQQQQQQQQYVQPFPTAPISFSQNTFTGSNVPCVQMPCSSKKAEVVKTNETEAFVNQTISSSENLINKTDSSKVQNILSMPLASSSNETSSVYNTATQPKLQNLSSAENKKELGLQKKHHIVRKKGVKKHFLNRVKM